MRQVKKPEVRKSEIVGAALRLFIERGYDKTTIEALIGELGVAKGCFYHHFRSKEDVFAACTAAVSDRLLAEFLEVLEDSSASPADRIVAFLDHTYRLADSDEYLLAVQTPTAADLDHQVSNRVAEQLVEAMTAVIEQGGLAGEFDVADAEFAAVAVVGALNNLHNRYVARAGLDLVEHRRAVLDLLGRMLGAQLTVKGAG